MTDRDRALEAAAAAGCDAFSGRHGVTWATTGEENRNDWRKAAAAMRPALLTTLDSEYGELKERINAACVGHPSAKIPWPHRLLHDCRDAIEALEAKNDRDAQRIEYRDRKLAEAVERAETAEAALQFVNILNLAHEGYEVWAAKPHNKKWHKKIDSTPIKNDLPVIIAEHIARKALTNQ